ncbi:hypothetical protein HK098_005197 [Nowakowskiella sp. JEL0407]|nr:hypothetical protein HK098_005197 [Nowakowskiella sp. JEL0407]
MLNLQHLPHDVLDLIFILVDFPYVLGSTCRTLRFCYTSLLLRFNSQTLENNQSDIPTRKNFTLQTPKNAIASITCQISLPIEKIPYAKHLVPSFAKNSISRFYIEAISHAVRPDVQINSRYVEALNIIVDNVDFYGEGLRQIPIKLKITWLQLASQSSNLTVATTTQFFQQLVSFLEIERLLPELVKVATVEEVKFVIWNRLYLPKEINRHIYRPWAYWEVNELANFLCERNIHEELDVLLQKIESTFDSALYHVPLIHCMDLAIQHNARDCFDALARKLEWLSRRRYYYELPTTLVIGLLCTDKTDILQSLLTNSESTVIVSAQTIVDSAMLYAKDTDVIDKILDLKIVNCGWTISVFPSCENVRIEFVDRYYPDLSKKSKEMISEAKKLLENRWQGYDALVNFTTLHKKNGKTGQLRVIYEVKDFYFGKWLDRKQFNRIHHIGWTSLKLLSKLSS